MFNFKLICLNICLYICIYMYVVVVRTMCMARMFVPTSVQLIKTDWRQCASPFGWTDQPERYKRPSAQITQPQGEEKDCEARPPQPPSPLEEGRRNIFHLLGVGCPGSRMT